MVRSMNKDAIIFAMANPEPEILPDLAKEAGAAVVGTGRSDYPNQINNVLIFPGLFKGALAARAKRITEEMKTAAAYALAEIIPEEELKPLVDAWRDANPNITELWWDVDRAVKEAVDLRTSSETHGIQFVYESGFLFICLPSGRRLAYVKPRIGENRFGGESVTYEGVGGTKKWERLESYGPKFVENIVQALSRDILCYAMKTLRCCNIVAHVHDEIIIEADPKVSLEAVCEQMGRPPPWAKGLILRADGYETPFYKKD